MKEQSRAAVDAAEFVQAKENFTAVLRKFESQNNNDERTLSARKILADMDLNDDGRIVITYERNGRRRKSVTELILPGQITVASQLKSIAMLLFNLDSGIAGPEISSKIKDEIIYAAIKLGWRMAEAEAAGNSFATQREIKASVGLG